MATTTLVVTAADFVTVPDQTEYLGEDTNTREFVTKEDDGLNSKLLVETGEYALLNPREFGALSETAVSSGTLVVRNGAMLNKATAVLPATTTGTLFTVASGRIVIRALVGRVTIVMQALDNLLTLQYNSTDPEVDTFPLAAQRNVNALAVGTVLSISDDADLPIALTMHEAGIVVGPGTIEAVTTATSTGSVTWDLYYEEIDLAAVVS